MLEMNRFIIVQRLELRHRKLRKVTPNFKNDNNGTKDIDFVDTKTSDPSSSVLNHSQVNLGDDIMKCWLFVPIALFHSVTQ